MELEHLNTLPQSQQAAYKGAIDNLVSQFNARIEKLEDKCNHLQKRVEFTQHEVDELAGEKKRLIKERKEDQERIDTLIRDNDSLRAKVINLEKRANYQEDYNRRNNLKISGVAERDCTETWEQTAEVVKILFEDKLQLPKINLERVYRMGQHQDDNPRTIVAHFSSYADREAVLRNVNKLKGTGIYISEDLCSTSQEIIRDQPPRLREAMVEGEIASSRHTRLVDKGRNLAYETTETPPEETAGPSNGTTLVCNEARPTPSQVVSVGGEGSDNTPSVRRGGTSHGLDGEDQDSQTPRSDVDHIHQASQAATVGDSGTRADRLTGSTTTTNTGKDNGKEYNYSI